MVIYIQGWMVCKKCRSNFLSLVNEVGRLKRFFDGFKNALCGVIDFDKGITIICNQCLA
jgi:hypothetical protein